MAKTTMKNITLNFPKLPENERITWAKTFGEENKDLENLLLELWRKGIQTYSCCAGHSTREYVGGGFSTINAPYMFFDVRNLTRQQQSILYKTLILQARMYRSVHFSMTLDYDDYFGSGVRHGLAVHGFNIGLISKTILSAVNNSTRQLDEIKLDLQKRGIRSELSLEEEKFVESLIELNDVNFTKYLDSVKGLKDDEKMGSIGLQHYKNNMSYCVTDNVKVQSCLVDDKFVFLSAGTYIPHPTKPNKYISLVNDVTINECSEDELVGLKEYTENRKLCCDKDYSFQEFGKVIERMPVRRNSRIIDTI